MSMLTASAVTITAPASTDGMGEIAVLNNSASGNFVGRLFETSGMGGAAVRQSLDEITEGHGAVASSFYYGPRSFTLKVLLARDTTWALSDTRYNKLCRAANAMAADGTIVWTDNDTFTKQISFRLEQPPSDPDEHGMVLLACTAPDPRIYNTTPQTGSSPKTNNGNSGTFPTFTLTPTGGNVVITRTTSGGGTPAVTLTQGTGYLSTGSAATIDFGARTVTQSTRKDGSVVFPTSTWWELLPGVSNSWTVTNASSVSISFRDAWLSG